MGIPFRSELDPLSPYNPPRAANEAAAERGAEDYVKLTSNELSFGPLPEVEAAIAEALPHANRYPDRRDGFAESAGEPGRGPREERAGGQRLQRGASQPPEARGAH